MTPSKLPVAGEGLVELVSTVLGEIEGPAVAGPGVLVNPPEDATGVAVGGFDDDRDVPLVCHWLAPQGGPGGGSGRLTGCDSGRGRTP